MNMYDIKNKEVLQKYGEELISFCQKRFGFKRPPKLFYVSDKENYHKLLGKTAYYDPQKEHIAIYIHGRHPKDILRSLAHELVHHMQNLNGDLHTGHLGPGYAQKDSKLRAAEEQAYKDGNMAFRDWEDLKKTKYKGENIMIENNLKEAIKLIVEKKLKKIKETSSNAGAAVEGSVAGAIKRPVVEKEIEEGAMAAAPRSSSKSNSPDKAEDEMVGPRPSLPRRNPDGQTDSHDDDGEASTAEKGPPGEAGPFEPGPGMMEEELEEEVTEGRNSECPKCKQVVEGSMEEHQCTKEGDENILDESRIVTPEQESSYHNKLFGTRLVALNAKLMSNFIKK